MLHATMGARCPSIYLVHSRVVVHVTTFPLGLRQPHLRVWMQMMDNMLLSVGELVNLKNVSLPKGSFIKIQPHTSDFLEISDPKAVLETSLRSFTCLTQVW